MFLDSHSIVNLSHWHLQMVREEGVSSLGRGVGPNVFRAILMNASQLASLVISSPSCGYVKVLTWQLLGSSYDFFKAELLKTPYFNDNIYCHFTASFAAVSLCEYFTPTLAC